MKTRYLKIWSAAATLAYLALTLVPGSLHARQITVPSGSILTIQQGVDAAVPGDTVIVRPGTYYDKVTIQWGAMVRISSDKPGLKLKAIGPPGSVKIIGPGWGVGIWVDADNALIEGFKISGFRDGISAGGSQTHGTRITGNIKSDCYAACIALTCANKYEIDHNTLDGTQPEPNNTESHGIFLNGYLMPGMNTQHYIHHNYVSGAQNIGIFLWQSSDCTIDHNICDNNGLMGIYLASSPNCTANNNQANNNGTENDGMGIVVGSSLNCVVANNETSNNTSFGIWIDDSWSIFERNMAEGNGKYDLFAPGWGSDPNNPKPNTYLKNQAVTAYPNLAYWNVKSSK